MNIQDWKPIETAPKDGTMILTYRDSATVPIILSVHWNEYNEYSDCPSGWYHSRNSVGAYLLDDCETPTHWMPLPELPQ